MCEFELPDVSLRCFVARQLLLRIYALSSVKFSGLKLWLCKKVTNMKYGGGAPWGVCTYDALFPVSVFLKDSLSEFQKPDVSEVVCQEIANSSLTVECSKLCQVNLRPKDCNTFGEKGEVGVQWPLIGKKSRRQEDERRQRPILGLVPSDRP